MSKLRLSAKFFLGTFGDFLAREPRLQSEFNDIQKLGVFSNFSACNHIVGHR